MGVGCGIKFGGLIVETIIERCYMKLWVEREREKERDINKLIDREKDR